jgi:hypothetical protein
MKRIVASVLSVFLLGPPAAFAQGERAGVVTTLEGNVTARRVALPDPVSLKFKDDVFLQDTVTTGDKSLARMLLGGKAVVTVRERSVLKITEVPGRSTIELETGKFALAVAREKMRPGEEIQIRTPNAIAGVRGTVVITEVNRQTAQLGAAAAAVLTRFYVLRGTITAQPLDIGTRQPLGTPLSIGAMQAYSGAGAATPTVAPVPPDQVGQITSGLQPSGPKGGSDAGQEQVKAQAVEAALTLLGTLTGGGATQMAAIVGAPATTVDTGALQTSTTAPLTVLDSIDVAAVELQIAGLIQFINRQLTLNAPVLTVNNLFVNPSFGPVIEVDHSTLNLVGAGLDFVRVVDPGTVGLLGPLATFHDSSLQVPGALLYLQGPSTFFLGLGGDALVQLEGSTIQSSHALNMLNGTMLLLGPYLTADGSTLRVGDGLKTVLALLFLADGALVTGLSPLPFLTFTDSTLDTAGNILSIRRSTASTPTRLTLTGPLLVAANSTFNHTSLGLATQFGAAPGPCCNAFFIGQGGQLSSTTSEPLIQLTSSTVTGNDAQSGGNFFNLATTFNGAPAGELVAPGIVSLSGPLLLSTNSTITELFSLIFVFQSALSSTSASPFVTINGGSVTLSGTNPFTGGQVFGNLLVAQSSQTFGQVALPSTVTLGGPLLSLNNATFNSGPGNVVSLVNGATYSAGGAGAMLQLSGSIMTGFNLLSIGGVGGPGGTTPASVTLAGPVLRAINSTITLGSNVVASFGGSAFTSTTNEALVQLVGTALTVGTSFLGSEVLQVNSVAGTGGNPGTATLSGPIFVSDAGSSLNISGALFGSFAGGQLFVNGSTEALFTFNGGTHAFGQGLGAVPIFGSDTAFSLNGLAAQTAFEIVEEGDPDVILELGTRKPVTTARGLLEMTQGATATTKGIAKIDTALVEATAPILTMKGGSNLTVANDGIDLVTKAKLTTGVVNPLIRLDASTLTIGNGHLAAVRGGSFLNIGGDFLAMNNGSTLNLNNGSFLLAQGGSLVKITGALVNFGGAGNTVNLTNNLCGSPCTVIGGLQVFLTNGAIAGNVSIAGPITNPGGGAINLSNGANTAHLVVDGANTKVRIGAIP